MLDMVLPRLLEISSNISCTMIIVMNSYEGEYLWNIQLYNFEQIAKQGRRCVFKVAFSQLGCIHESKM